MSPEWRIGDYIYSTTKENLTTILTGKIKFNKPVKPQEKKSQNRNLFFFFFFQGKAKKATLPSILRAETVQCCQKSFAFELPYKIYHSITVLVERTR